MHASTRAEHAACAWSVERGAGPVGERSRAREGAQAQWRPAPGAPGGGGARRGRRRGRSGIPARSPRSPRRRRRGAAARGRGRRGRRGRGRRRQRGLARWGGEGCKTGDGVQEGAEPWRRGAGPAPLWPPPMMMTSRSVRSWPERWALAALGTSYFSVQLGGPCWTRRRVAAERAPWHAGLRVEWLPQGRNVARRLLLRGQSSVVANGAKSGIVDTCCQRSLFHPYPIASAAVKRAVRAERTHRY